MIFVSDLDRTLIFSRRFLIPGNIILVEKAENREISYMTGQAINLLKEIMKAIVFIPVTTRIVQQFKRISLFQSDIVPEYAVTSNGGRILVKGEIDEEWDSCIMKRMKDVLHPSEIFQKFERIIDSCRVNSCRLCDDMFWTVIMEENYILEEELYNYINWASNNKWKILLSGRKLYILPEFINKWNAVEYINRKLGYKKIISAGDSLVDYELLKKSSLAFVPSHGEIRKYMEVNNIKEDHIRFTESTGIMAGEEILRSLCEYVKSEKK
ncbi:MAG TPA: HAD family hydrolase [Candidatus Eremiobacteraeota bacterium]|mgnify:CR=1 FL=1|nr:MAG: Sucrose-6F-phosphate phosphohydrolase [bacterium ADurb.Bin363]HPZ06534.1 HAD family hydrolase [Candidatus Eremiobacteraeota bacterium]